MHEDRTCVGIFNLHRGWLSLHRGPPVNVPIRKTAHCITSFLQMARREACWYQQIFLAAGIEPGTSSTRSQCANHSATSFPRCCCILCPALIDSTLSCLRTRGEFATRRTQFSSADLQNKDLTRPFCAFI